MKVKPVFPKIKTSPNTLAWLVSLSAALFFFYIFIQMNVFNIIGNDLMESFGINPAKLGKLSAMYFYANLIFLFPAGALLDRYSTKKIVIAAMALSTVSTFMFGLAHSFFIAALSRFIIGIAGSFCFLGAIRLSSRWFPPNKMAFVTGVIVTMAMIGGLMAQTPSALLSEAIGWRNTMLVDGGLGIVILIIMLLVIQDYPPKQKKDVTTDHNKTEKIGLLKTMRCTFLYYQNWLNGLYTSLLNLSVFILGALWGIPYLTQVQKITRVEASYATTIFFFGVILGSPMYGWISDHIGRRKAPMIVGAILSLITILILMYTPHLSLSMIILLFFLIGFFTSSQVLSYPTIAELNPSTVTGTAVSIASIIIMLGGAIAQPLFGHLLESHWNHTFMRNIPIFSTYDFKSAMLILPISIVLSLVCAVFIKETYCKPIH